MRRFKWINTSLPQTLLIATYLMYLEAVFAILFGSVRSLVFLVVTAGFIIGALGVSNERRRGYYAAVVTAVFNVAITVWLLLTSGFGVIFALAIAIAILALLLNRQSSSYQRIWFR